MGDNDAQVFASLFKGHAEAADIASLVASVATHARAREPQCLPDDLQAKVTDIVFPLPDLSLYYAVNLYWPGI